MGNTSSDYPIQNLVIPIYMTPTGWYVAVAVIDHRTISSLGTPIGPLKCSRGFHKVPRSLPYISGGQQAYIGSSTGSTELIQTKMNRPVLRPNSTTKN